MGIHKTVRMDCDFCGKILTSSDGEVTGSDEYVLEIAGSCGWERIEGHWYCGACRAGKEPAQSRTVKA